jgi:hypothetical protein
MFSITNQLQQTVRGSTSPERFPLPHFHLNIHASTTPDCLAAAQKMVHVTIRHLATRIVWCRQLRSLCIRRMASSSLRTSPQLHHRYQYHMLPSKDDSALRVTESPNSLVDDRDELFRGDGYIDDLSWKKQAIVDLKPSRHRDT